MNILRPEPSRGRDPRLTSPTLAMALVLCLSVLSHSPAAGTQVTIDFDTYPGGGVVPPGPSIGDQWQGLGVVFSDPLGGPVGASNNNCSLSAPNHAYAGTIVATFVDTLTGLPAVTDYVGTAQDNCWVGGEGIAMRAYDAQGALIASTFNPPDGVNGNGHFEAFSFGSAVIARVEMDCFGQGIDNFVFGRPTPVGAVSLPSAFGLARPANPSFGGRVTLALFLPDASAARLELIDVTGRRVAGREVGSLGPGSHAVRLGDDGGIRPGVYFVRLSRGAKVALARVTILD